MIGRFEIIHDEADVMDTARNAIGERLVRLGLEEEKCGVASRDDGDVLIELELVRNLVHNHTRRLARYLCENCGFKARQFYWHCPACGGWETYPPKRTEEFELAP